MYMKIYVSLTSIFQKQKHLLNTLHSISNQSLKPDKCFIYLSEKPYLLDKGFKDKYINNELKQFIDNNPIFQIKWCENIGPYRKLFYLLKEKWNEDCLILTIDDDIFFHPNLIKDYVNDYNKYKCCISYRGCSHDFKNHDFSDFHYEKRKPIVLKNLFNFANSGVGTVTHPSFFHKTKDLIFDLNLINELCKTTDDIWYYFCRIANNIETVLILKLHYFKFNHYKFNETALYANFNNRKNTNTINFQNTAKKFIQLKLM